MEAIWKYFYWQALSTNPLDEIGHVLRLSIVVGECSSYQVNPSEELLDSCNQFLGPTQPGVTTPDPTEGGAAAAASSSPPTPDRSEQTSTDPTETALDFLLAE